MTEKEPRLEKKENDDSFDFMSFDRLSHEEKIKLIEQDVALNKVREVLQKI